MFRRIFIRALAAGLLSASAAPVFASAFDFVPAPQTDLNRVYRMRQGDRARSSSWSVAVKEGTVGITLLLRAGRGREGAGSGVIWSDRLAPMSARAACFALKLSQPAEMSVWLRFRGEVACTPPGNSRECDAGATLPQVQAHQRASGRHTNPALAPQPCRSIPGPLIRISEGRRA